MRTTTEAVDERTSTPPWGRVRLATISSFITKGSTPTTYGFKWESSGVLFLRSECVSEHGLDLAQSMFISEEAHATFQRSQVRRNDLLITITGNVGRVVIFQGADQANVNQHIARVRITAPNADPRFIYYWLSQPSVRRYFEGITTGQAYPQISLQQVRNAEVPLPPLSEQRAIAAALTDVDALLDGLDRLIAKKRDLKQAAMQQLLTGRTRLPGFEGEWKEVQLGHDAILLSGSHVLARHCNTSGEGIPYLTGPADFPDGRIHHSKYTTRPSTICAPLDILVTVKGSGSGTLVLANDAYCISRQLMALRVREWDVGFVYYSLLQNADSFRAAATGLIPGLSRSDILDQRLPVPPTVSEQTAIAAVLSDMDAELAALEARRDKTRALKQAMMQELLTGRTRLV